MRRLAGLTALILNACGARPHGAPTAALPPPGSVAIAPRGSCTTPRLRGSVRHAGQPVAGATLVANTDVGPPQTAITDDDGYFVIDLPTDHGLITVYLADVTAELPFHAGHACAGWLVIDLQHPPGSRSESITVW